MTGVHQNFNGARDLITPLTGTICHSCTRTCYQQLACQIWSLYFCKLRRYKRGTKCQKWDGLG